MCTHLYTYICIWIKQSFDQWVAFKETQPKDVPILTSNHHLYLSKHSNITPSNLSECLRWKNTSETMMNYVLNRATFPKVSTCYIVLVYLKWSWWLHFLSRKGKMRHSARGQMRHSSRGKMRHSSRGQNTTLSSRAKCDTAPGQNAKLSSEKLNSVQNVSRKTIKYLMAICYFMYLQYFLSACQQISIWKLFKSINVLLK